MAAKTQMQSIAIQRAPTVADQVFVSLHEQILTLELPPGTKLSEAEVSRQMGISRQPVREAFFRLSQLGFLLIRPQRATVVRPISEADVLQAMYIRRALESEVLLTAVTTLEASALADLSDLLDQQEQAVATGDKILFHNLDDKFHKTICDASGAGFVWTLIKEKKAHMDRVRYLTLSFAAGFALNEHKEILAAIQSRDSDQAIQKMRKHLGRIEVDLPRIRLEHAQHFSRDDCEDNI